MACIHCRLHALGSRCRRAAHLFGPQHAVAPARSEQAGTYRHGDALLVATVRIVALLGAVALAAGQRAEPEVTVEGITVNCPPTCQISLSPSPSTLAIYSYIYTSY